MNKGDLIDALGNWLKDDVPIWIYIDERQEYLPIDGFMKGMFRHFKYQRRTGNLTTEPVEFDALVLVAGWTGNMEKLETQ